MVLLKRPNVAARAANVGKVQEILGYIKNYLERQVNT